MIRITRSAVIDPPIERMRAVRRDFNSLTAWHPVLAESDIEGGERSDRSAASGGSPSSTGRWRSGGYVATLHLKRVIDGERTTLR